MLTGVWKVMNVFVLCVLVQPGYSGVRLNRRKHAIRRRIVVSEWQNVWLACRVPFDAVHEMNGQLHDIVEHGVGGSPADGLADAVAHVEKTCYELARESIAAVGMMLQEHQELRGLVASKAGSSSNPLVEEALELIDTIEEAKQCLAYVEMAKRGDPKSLYWAWLNNAGSVADRDQACGDLVNGVNALLTRSKIPGARITKAENGEDAIVVEDFPLADRLRKAEIQAGLRDILTNAMMASAATTGSLLAYVCNAWVERATF